MSENQTRIEKPVLCTTKFLIILFVFLFLTCVGIPVWHFSTRAKRISIKSYLNISSSDLEWNQLSIVKFSQEMLDRNISRFVELDEHFDSLVLGNGMKVISKNTEWKKEWKNILEDFSKKYGNLAKLKAWLNDECFDVVEQDENLENLENEKNGENGETKENIKDGNVVIDENLQDEKKNEKFEKDTSDAQQDIQEFTSIDPIRGLENQFSSEIRIYCVKDRTDDAIFINRRGEMKLYTPKKAFKKRLNAFGRSILRIKQSPDIKQELKKVTLHIVNLDPKHFIITDFPNEWSSNRWLFLKRLQSIYGDFQVKDSIMYYGHIPGWRESNDNESISIKARDMQYLLNENSNWKFEAPNDPENQLHFLILVAPDLKNVTLLDYNNHPSLFNAYTIPRWGGVSILTEENLSEENRKKWNQYKEDLKKNNHQGYIAPMKLQLSLEEMHPFIEIFTSQLRSMLGIIDPDSAIRASPELQTMLRIIPDNRIGITGWELMLHKRRKTIEFCFNAARSLTSLIKVIDSMPDVMIDANIGLLAKESLTYLKIADEAAQRGWWNDAVISARLANEKAEEAFFHPSIVSLLYFPISQKLAVFLPFALPVFITVTISLLREIGQYFSKIKSYKKQKND